MNDAFSSNPWACANERHRKLHVRCWRHGLVIFASLTIAFEDGKRPGAKCLSLIAVIWRVIFLEACSDLSQSVDTGILLNQFFDVTCSSAQSSERLAFQL